MPKLKIVSDKAIVSATYYISDAGLQGNYPRISDVSVNLLRLTTVFKNHPASWSSWDVWVGSQQTHNCGLSKALY